MERRLIVMRHAKSSWNTEGMSDHERPLNKRGRHDTPRIAHHLIELGWQAQHIVSSDAQRTRETAVQLLAQWEDGIQVDFLASLYLAGFEAFHDALSSVNDEIDTLLFLGHNPGCESIVHRLTDELVVMKTATAALLTAECESWSDAHSITWELQQVIYPRDLD